MKNYFSIENQDFQTGNLKVSGLDFFQLLDKNIRNQTGTQPIRQELRQEHSRVFGGPKLLDKNIRYQTGTQTGTFRQEHQTRTFDIRRNISTEHQLIRQDHSVLNGISRPNQRHSDKNTYHQSCFLDNTQIYLHQLNLLTIIESNYDNNIF